MKLPPSPRAVVTGAASGLGRALAVALGARAGRVVLADVHEERTAETAELVARAGGTAVVVRCDVSRIEDVEAVADEAERRWGGTDLLFNNAGVAVAGHVGDVPLADWQWILGVNLWGVIHGCHVFVPRMKAAGAGAIVNVASSAAFASLPEMGPYNVSKAAVVSLSETLDAELTPLGLHVSVLCPTFFRSGLLETFRAAEPSQRRLAEALFRRTRVSADDVARITLRAVEDGRFWVIPQADGALLWRAKRAAPWLLRRILHLHQRRSAR
jgi:NAD(P)-dependent dehydrogenase (short-subunit alcohol dehydrogenase family)